MPSGLFRALVAALLLGVLTPAAPGRAQQPPPNIVLIVTDDGPTAEELAFLPRLREMLFEPGVAFDAFLTPNPLCCPSRTSILRGQYCRNTGILTNDPPDGGFWGVYGRGMEAEMLPVWLARAGYATALFGKYLNGYLRRNSPAPPEYVPPGWTEWYGGAWTQRGYGFRLNENGKVVEYPKDGPHANDVLAARAVDFVRRRAAGGALFLMISTGAPHEPSVPALRHRGEFREARLPRRPSFNEQDVSDKPAWVRRLRPLARRDRAALRREFRNRLRSMLSVEDLVAAVLGELAAQGVMGRTYVFYLVDNGLHRGEHRINDVKGTPYEEAIVVPAAVRGPGVPAGGRRPHLVANHDLAATFLELAGAPPPAILDGRSLLPLLAPAPPEPAAWRRALALQSADVAAGSGTFRGLRTLDAKYVRHGAGEEEYYDLTADPFELRNLASGGATPAGLAALRAWSDALGTCAAEPCRSLELSWP